MEPAGPRKVVNNFFLLLRPKVLGYFMLGWDTVFPQGRFLLRLISLSTIIYGDLLLERWF